MPNRHGGLVVANGTRRQSPTRGLSRRACSGDGKTPAPARTVRFGPSTAPIRASPASAGVAGRTAVVPSTSAIMTGTTAAVTAMLRPSRGVRRSATEKRSGRSIRRMVSHAGPALANTSAVFAGQASSPRRDSARTSTGQCHRYQVYESRPTARTRISVSARPTTPAGPA